MTNCFVAMESFTCSKCAKNFSYKRSLIKHEKDGSCVNKESQKTVIQCPKPECTKTFGSHELYRKHVEVEHNLNLETEDHFFQTYKDFKEWKENFEKQNVCFYFVRSSWKMKNGIKRYYLHCHRSGYYTSESKGVRRIKSQGSNKIDSTCTSFMTVVENHTGVHVTCCTTHFGHESNLGRCNLTDNERAMIAGKIAEGVSFEKILDEIRDNVSSNFSVTTLITKRDLFNIRRDFNLIDGQFHQSDYISVCLHKAGMNMNPEIEQTSETTWIVKSATEKKRPYDVSKIRDVCDIDDCKLKCRSCNICIHMYICDCPDYLMKLNICKHIHACMIMQKKPITNHLSNQVADNFESLEKVLVNNDSRSEEEKKKTLIIQKMKIGIELLSSSEHTMEEYSIMDSKIDSFLDIARKKRKIVDVQNKEPANKNISKQIRLVSNKKISKKPILKPSFSLNEKSAIKKAFQSSNDGREVINIHQGSDHQYTV